MVACKIFRISADLQGMEKISQFLAETRRLFPRDPEIVPKVQIGFVLPYPLKADKMHSEHVFTQDLTCATFKSALGQAQLCSWCRSDQRRACWWPRPLCAAHKIGQLITSYSAWTHDFLWKLTAYPLPSHRSLSSLTILKRNVRHIGSETDAKRIITSTRRTTEQKLQ